MRTSIRHDVISEPPQPANSRGGRTLIGGVQKRFMRDTIVGAFGRVNRLAAELLFVARRARCSRSLGRLGRR